MIKYKNYKINDKALFKKCMILSMRNIEQIKHKNYKKLRSKALIIRIKYDHVRELYILVFRTVHTLFFTSRYILQRADNIYLSSWRNLGYLSVPSSPLPNHRQQVSWRILGLSRHCDLAQVHWEPTNTEKIFRYKT